MNPSLVAIGFIWHTDRTGAPAQGSRVGAFCALENLDIVLLHSPKGVRDARASTRER